MSKADIRVNLCGVELKNPVITASGTFGYGQEYTDFMDVSALGGICSKGVTYVPKYGNEGRRLAETPAGLINSIGLQNPGVQHFIDHELPAMLKLGPAVLANLGGASIEDYEAGAALLDATEVPLIELNISCPNVKAGGIAYGVKCESAREVVRRVRAATRKPLIVKLSPQAEDLAAMARTCQEAGADGVSLVNTFTALAIDIERRKPVFNNLYAGLSGPAIKPIALRMVHQVCRAVQIPVVGLGGITSAADAIEFIMAGATAIQVGTANFLRPGIAAEIAAGIQTWCDDHGVKDLNKIRGCV